MLAFQTTDRFRSSFWWIAVALLFTSCEFKEIAVQGVEAVNIESFKGGELKGVMNVSLSNPNSMAVTVKSATFDIYAGSMKLGEAKLDESFKIKANSSKTYPVKLSGSMGNALAGGLVGLAGFLGGKNPKITLKGEIKARSFLVSKKIPVEVQTELPLDRLRHGN